MSKPYNRKLYNPQQGAVLAEFAIIVPFLLLLLAGIAEIGYLYFNLNNLNKSVQDGALYLADAARARQNGVFEDIIDVSSTNSNIADAKEMVIYGSIIPSPAPTILPTPLLPDGDDPLVMDIDIDCIPDDATDGSIDEPPCEPTTHHIRVKAEYQHEFMLGSLLNAMCNLVANGDCFPNDDQYLLKASSVFRVEGGTT